MKVLAINGSSRQNGNTSKIIEVIFEELRQRGIECELIELANRDVAPCKACFACAGKRNCLFKNDSFCEIMKKMIE